MATEAQKHTPGPWIVLDGEITFEGEDSDVVIAIVNDGYKSPSVAESEANARLIAVAPDMLAALKECALQIAQTHNRKLTSDEQIALDNARAAIAKATGEAK